MKIFGIVRSAANLIIARYNNEELKQPNITDKGNIAVEQILTGPSGLVPTPADTDDNSVPSLQVAPLNISENYVFSQTNGVWIRMHALTDSDATPSSSNHALVVIPHLQIFNGVNWDRWRSIDDDTDGQIPLTFGTPGIVSRLQALNDSGNFDRLRSGSSNTDSQAVFVTGILNTNAHNLKFNGTTFDRERNNTDITVLTSAARTLSIDSADLTNHNARGMHLVIDVTAITGAPSIVITIQGKDILSGKYYTILVSAAINAVGTTILRVYPALTAAANLISNDILTRTWRVSVVNANADSITYSVGASLIL